MAKRIYEMVGHNSGYLRFKINALPLTKDFIEIEYKNDKEKIAHKLNMTEFEALCFIRGLSSCLVERKK